MAVLYLSLDANFDNLRDTKAIIAKIDNIINELLKTALVSVQSGNIVEYKIDTGQSVQNVQYRDPNAIVKVIEGYRRLRQLYVNDIIGNQFRQVDGKNLMGPGRFVV